MLNRGGYVQTFNANKMARIRKCKSMDAWMEVTVPPTKGTSIGRHAIYPIKALVQTTQGGP
jgi:hypothetical protein